MKRTVPVQTDRHLLEFGPAEQDNKLNKSAVTNDRLIPSTSAASRSLPTTLLKYPAHKNNTENPK